MKLFNMDTETFVLDFEPEVFAIKEFAQIIKRDKSKFKTTAQAELAYIWFFCDFKSDFMQILDEDERRDEIINSLDGLPKDWKPDKLIDEAIERYIKLSRGVAFKLLDDARSIMDNMTKHAKEVSSNLETDDMPKIQKYLEGLPKLMETLSKLEESVLREKDSSVAHRGTQEKALFEDEE